MRTKETDYYFRKISRIIMNEFKTSYDLLQSKSRKGEIVLSRQYIMYFLYDKTELSLQGAADYFNLDHATCLHAINTINNRKTYPKFLARHDEILTRIDRIPEYGYYQCKDFETVSLEVDEEMLSII